MRFSTAIGSTAAALLLVQAFAAPAAAGDPDKGRPLFNQCRACHALEAGQNRLGPTLHGVFGRKAGAVEGFRYSKVMERSDVVWTDETLDAYLADPRGYMPGNRMTYVGLRRPEQRADLIAYLKQATQ